MITPSLPLNENERLKALNGYHLLDTLPEEDFDNITYLASVICQTPISLITLIDKDRQFFKSRLGIDINQTHKDLSFCAHAINQPQILFEVEDVRLDERFHDNDFVTGQPKVAFYAGIALVDAAGFALGTLCVIDQKPRKLTFEQKEALTKLSKQVMFIIEARQKKIIEEELKLVDFTFNNSAMPIILIKEDSTIRNVNHAAARDLGYTQEELKGKKIIEIDDNFDEEKWALHWAEIKAKGSLTIKTTPTKKDGTTTNLVIYINYLKHGDLELICSYSTDITEKIKQEEQMKLVDYAFRNSTTPINIINQDASIFEFNEAAHKLLGYTHEEYKAITVPDIDPDYQFDIWPIHWEELKKAKSLSFETTLKKKNGDIINANIEANFIQYGDKELNCVFFTDITEKKKQEQQLQLLDYSYKHTDSAMSFLDENALFIDFNQATANMLGYSYEEFRGKTLMDINPMVTKEFWVNRWEDLKVNPNQKFEAKFKKKDGTLIDVAVSTNSIELNGKIVNFGFYEDITEKKKLEENLKLSAFTIANAAWGLAYVKADGTLYNCNLAFAKLYGNTSLEEMKTKTAFDFGSAYTPDTWKQYWEELKQKKSLHYIVQRTKKDGTIIHLEINANMIQFGDLELNCIYVNDITEKKKAEAEIYAINELLQSQTNRLLLATKSAKIGIWDRDLENDSTIWDEGMYKLYGIAPNEFKTINEGWTARLHDEDRTKIFDEMQFNIANKNEFNSEFRIVWNDESIHYIKTSGFIQRVDGKPKRIIGVSWDVTKDKEMELEKETLLKELVANNLELKQFSYITSHNLRAPLTNLVSICDIIQPAIGTDDITLQLIDAFKTSTYHLNETLNDLIEVLIIKENRNITKEQLTFEEIFKKTKESISISLLENKVTINEDFSEAPSVIFANEYLQSVFLNLLTNAVKYRHPDRALIITIKTSKENNGTTKLTFSDNGIGINMAHAKDKIFGLYKRFHNNANSKGIGLYLIHSQITTLGGKIEVESEVNIGTTFTIIFN